MRRIASTLLLGFILSIVQVPVQAEARTSITRAEAVALAVDSQSDLKGRLQWYMKNMPPIGLFLDVDKKSWYAPYLETAFEAGIIVSNSTRTFRPKDPITIEEAAALMTRLKNRQTASTILFYNPGNRPWQEVVIAEATSTGISMPTPVRVGTAVSLADYHQMMRSAGVQNPQLIALTINPAEGYLPKPVMVAQAPAPARVQPITRTNTTAQVAQPQAPAPQPTSQPTTTQANTDAFTITIPAAGIENLAVIHPTDPFTSQGLLAPLQNGVGHLFSYPGKKGKILIYGHSSSYPWDVSTYTKIFREINKLNNGDKIYITYNGKQYTYEVYAEEAVPANDMSRYQGSGEEILILYTCWPPDSISQRYLVYARPV